METLIKLNNQTAGRDKIARFLQYLSRFLWHRLQQKSINKEGVDRLKNFEYQLSTFRKLLRFGRFSESLYAAIPLCQYEDTTIRYTLILSKICNSLFLLADHLLWLGRADVCNVNTDKWSRFSNKYWLYSIAMNLIRDFYEIHLILKSQKCNIVPSNGVNSFSDVLSVISRTINMVQFNNSIMIDTVKNGCDIFIPLVALGHVKLSPGTVGLLGVISSLAGLLVLIEPCKKLKPS